MKKVDLLNGPITVSLAKLAFPIMGTSLIQMAYNLTDMIWIGRISSYAVAAVGSAGMFTWFFSGMITMPRMGGQIKVAHLLGAGEHEEAIEYARGDIQVGLILSILFAILSVVLAKPLISFFNFSTPSVIKDAEVYLMITGGLTIFNFMNQILTGLMTAMGSSMVTFRATTVGLFVNIVLDPVLIFGIGPFPRMGVAGAALATIIAQFIVFLMYLRIIKDDPIIFTHLNLFHKTSSKHIKEIMKIGFPVGLQSMLFSCISMTIARIVAGWGDAAVAIQKVGAQIESISWLTAEGFGTAVNSFIANNYGAGKKERVKKGYLTALVLMAGWGIITGLALIIFPEPIMRIFIKEADIIPMGVDYLRILGLSELFCCMEMTSAGACQGMGKPVPSSIISVVFTALRIPMALALSATALGLNGVWWSICISSILKGLIVPAWFLGILSHYMKKTPQAHFIKTK